MKKVLISLCALLLLLLCACGGSGGDPTPSQTVSPTPTAPAPTTSSTPAPTSAQPTAAPTQEPVVEPDGPVSPLTGLPMDEELAGMRPVAIMLNNIKAAMPQQGVSRADIIYEVLAEGGITRMLGVYQDISRLDTVGSVRSARQYYLELAMGHDAVYVHAGGSPEVYSYIEKNKIKTVDGVNGPFSYASATPFWRDRERVAGHYYAYEHSLITSGERLTRALSNQGMPGSHRADYASPLTFGESSALTGQSAATVTVTFSGSKTTTFRYDEAAGHYLAEQYGSPYADGNDGTQVSAANVLILRAETRVVDDAGRLKIDLSDGEGWYACGGRIVPILWTKGGANAPLRYTLTDGSPLTLTPGTSYVCIIPASRTITAE